MTHLIGISGYVQALEGTSDLLASLQRNIHQRWPCSVLKGRRVVRRPRARGVV